MTLNHDVAAVARSLTKAQHTALRNLGCAPDPAAWQLAPYDGWRRSGQACSALCKIGLAERASPGTRFQDQPAYRLNDLGLAVRAHLKEQER